MSDGGNHSGAGQGPAGSILRATAKDGPKRVETSGKTWSEEAEALFLEELAASCNVRMAAAACGFSIVTVYRRRWKDAAFAGKWEQALDQGYITLEFELLRAARDHVTGIATGETPIIDMSVNTALRILEAYRARNAKAGRRRSRFQARPRSLDEVRDSILIKLESIEIKRRALSSGEADGEAGEQAPESGEGCGLGET